MTELSGVGRRSTAGQSGLPVALFLCVFILLLNILRVGGLSICETEYYTEAGSGLKKPCAVECTNLINGGALNSTFNINCKILCKGCFTYIASQRQTIAAITPPTKSNTTTTRLILSPTESSGMSDTLIAVIVLGVVVGIIVIFSVALVIAWKEEYIICHKKKPPTGPQPEGPADENIEMYQLHPDSSNEQIAGPRPRNEGDEELGANADETTPLNDQEEPGSRRASDSELAVIGNTDTAQPHDDHPPNEQTDREEGRSDPPQPSVAPPVIADHHPPQNPRLSTPEAGSPPVGLPRNSRATGESPVQISNEKEAGDTL